MQLTISNLSKTYPNGVKALDRLSLHIPCGMFGLLGPNGAGKSTLMRTLATLQTADTGTVMLDTFDMLRQPDEVKKILGYLPQEFGVYPKVTAFDLLSHYALLKGIGSKKERREIVMALLHQVNLYTMRNKHVSSYSGGMKQRFGIAQALLGNPKLIIVDEPTAGLDPAERIRFNNLLSEISENKIVILSTHIVDDVSDLCSNMAIIQHGKVILTGNPSSLMNQLDGMVWTKKIRKEEYEDYRINYSLIFSHLQEGQPLIHIISESDPGEGFRPIPAALEDVYFSTLKP
jgi:ABC-2 type transport system ATP-binding protein